MYVRISFRKNDEATLGLPMRLIIFLIIGMATLLAILSFMMNPCVFPQKMIVSVSPMVAFVPGNDSTNLTFTVNVSERGGQPLQGASVIIRGLGGAGAGFTDDFGVAIISLGVHMERGIHEGYLGISVSAPCHELVLYQELIKIVHSDS